VESGYEPKHSAKDREIEAFARQVADHLVKAHNEGRFEKLCLVASPEFLGVLRKVVEPRLGRTLSQEINKDYTQASPQELRRHLREHRP
jgi:protein required for attachment to host cells